MNYSSFEIGIRLLMTLRCEHPLSYESNLSILISAEMKIDYVDCYKRVWHILVDIIPKYAALIGHVNRKRQKQLSLP